MRPTPDGYAESVDRGVELVVAAHRDEPVATGCVLEARRIQEFRRGELRFAALCLPDPLASLIALIKTSGLPHAFLVAVEHLGIGLLDLFADQRIVSDPLVPLQLRVRRQRG